MVPANLGPFEIIGSLGGGVHGTVYRARHTSHGRIVVIKQLAATLAEDSPEYTQLWNEIARLRAAVSNHIATTHSVELIEGRPVIETESLGESLEKVLGNRPLALPDALSAVRDMLSGLKVLHAAGITHANLRPSNVLQDTTTGNWKLADGGVTAIESGTTPTLLAASLLYVAPEVLTRRGEPGERSDLYSAGLMGLQAAIGTARMKDAFPDVSNLNSPSRWLEWVEHSPQEAVPLHLLNPETPEPVSRFLSRMVAKDPAQRFSSVFAALVELEAILPLVAPTKVETAPPVATVQLLISGPVGFEQHIELSNRTYRVGRDPQNDIVLPDETKSVSRVHAELRREGGRYVLNDLESQNGLLVNGKRKPSVQLTPGVTVKIGEYALSLSSGTAVDVQTSQTRAGAKTVADRMTAAAWWPPTSSVQWATLVGIGLLVVAGVGWIVTRNSGSGVPAPVAVPVDPVAANNPAPAPPPSVPESNPPAASPVVTPNDPTTPPVEPKKPVASPGSGRSAKPPANAAPTYQPQVARRAGESEADWFARDRRLSATAASARQAMEAGDVANALTLWRSIQSEEPAYPNLDTEMSAARARMSQAAQSALQAGHAFEKSGELLRARESFQRARDLDPDSGAAAALGALSARMLAEGERAFRDGTDNENYQKFAEARLAYQKAFDYLPDDHPRKKLAKAALDRIGK